MYQFHPKPAETCVSFIGSTAHPIVSLLPHTLDPLETIRIPDYTKPTVTQSADKGFMLSYKGGKSCQRGLYRGPSLVRFQLLCEPGQEAQIGEVNAAQDRCDYTVQIHSRHGCIVGMGKEATSAVSTWYKTLAWFIVVGACLYLAVGLAYNVLKLEMPLTIEAIPHIEFWRTVPDLVQEGILFTYIQVSPFIQGVVDKVQGHSSSSSDYVEVNDSEAYPTWDEAVKPPPSGQPPAATGAQEVKVAFNPE